MDDVTTLTENDRSLLEQAAGFRCSGLDLRFEGGPWIADLDRLVAWGLLAFEEHGPGYMVSYTITESGRRALARSSGESGSGGVGRSRS